MTKGVNDAASAAESADSALPDGRPSQRSNEADCPDIPSGCAKPAGKLPEGGGTAAPLEYPTGAEGHAARRGPSPVLDGEVREDADKDKLPGVTWLRLGVLAAAGLRLGVPIENLSEVCSVTSLGAPIVPYRGALGSLNLRGLVVPIFDHAQLTGYSTSTSAGRPPYAAMLRHEERLIGIGIEEIEGFIQISPDMLQPIARSARGATPFTSSLAPPSLADDSARADRMTEAHALRGSLYNDGNLVSVIDPPALFAMSGLPSAVRRPPAGNAAVGPGVPGTTGSTASGPRTALHRTPGESVGAAAPKSEPALAFSAGGATFGVPASSIHATVPRTAIEQNSLSVGACIGSIIHHGQRIPVLRTPEIIGLGVSDGQIEAEIVLMRCEGEERIGLAVDTINRMLAVDREHLRVVPQAIGREAGLISGVILDPASGEQVFMIDTDRLVALPAIAELAALSRKTAPDQTARRKGSADVTEEQTRHLVFEAGTAIAAPVAQVLRILTPPDRIVPSPQAMRPGVKGVFSIARRPVVYVDLAEMLGLHAESPCSRVLLVEDGPHQVGFAVRKVTGIDTSVWRRREAGSGAEIVQLGHGTARQVLPAVDLARLAAAILQ